MKGLDGLDRKEVVPNLSSAPKAAEEPANLAAALASLSNDTRIGVQLAMHNGATLEEAIRGVVAAKLPNL